MDFKERIERFHKKYGKKRDYLLFKVPVRTRQKVSDDHVIDYQLSAVYANSGNDMERAYNVLVKKGASLIDGNFINKDDERVQFLMSKLQNNNAIYEQAKADAIKELESKKSDKVEEVKKRLGKSEDKADEQK